MVPTVLRVRGYRFFFYSSDQPEPPHVHVESGDNEAKFWLDPVTLANAVGYDARELRRVEQLVIRHREHCLRAWYAFFGSR